MSPVPTPGTGAAPARSRSRKRLRTAQDVRQGRRRLLSYGLLAFSFILMVNAVVGETGYLATIRAEREYDAVTRELNAVLAENERLAGEIHRLRYDRNALEEAARRSLNLMRPGETLIILKDPAPEPSRPSVR